MELYHTCIPRLTPIDRKNSAKEQKKLLSKTFNAMFTRNIVLIHEIL